MECSAADQYLPSVGSFKSIQSASVQDLVKLPLLELRAILPSLVRTSLCTSLDISENFVVFQQEVRKKISEIEGVNFIASVLSIDFNMVHEDAVKEQRLRQKLGANKMNDDLLSKSLQKALILEFEESDALKRTRLVLSEILRIISVCQENEGKFESDETELFECIVYLEEISDVLCIVFAELPFLMPIPEVSEALLRVRLGPWILCCIVANNSDCFDVVCSSILSHAVSSDEMEIETQVRMKTLKMLCSMNPQYSKILRAECVSLCKLAGLAIELSITTTNAEPISDIVPFFTGMLLASDSKTKSWISDYMKTAQKEHRDTALTLFKAQLVKEMKYVISCFKGKQSSMDCDAMDTDLSMNDLNNSTMHGIAIMKLYCALSSITGLKMSHEESEVLVNMITCNPMASDVGVRYVVVSICTLVACAFLISEEREEKITSWLKALVEKSSQFEDGEPNSSYGETLLLIAIHFHSHSLEPIVELISSTLGIKLKPSSLTKVKIVFTQQVFQEKVVAEHALTVPVTKNLNKHNKGFLPVHCVHQLMKSRVFTKHGISVKDWLFKQLCTCSSPVHPLLLPLIETYIHSIITPLNISRTKQQRMNALQPFSEERLFAVFRDKSVACCDSETTKLLLMLYALMYQNALLGNMKTLVNNPSAPLEYPPSLYSAIPIKQLFLLARDREVAYGDLYPTLLRLLTTHYPHLCLVEDWVEEEKEKNTLSSKMPQDVENVASSKETRRVLEYINENPQKALIFLSRLTLLPASELIGYKEFVLDLLPKMLDMSRPRKIQTLVAKVWMKLNTVTPRKLWLDTVNILRKQPDNIRYKWEKTPVYTTEEIQKDPLIVLRCDPRVYRCPPVLEINLRVLNGYLTASRALLSHHLLANPVAAGSKPPLEIMAIEKEREELKSTLISTQESAALQILLEVCLPTELENKTATYSVSSTLREIQCQICRFIHQSFISQPSMAKLIHFQCYPADLLSVTVAGVPSMHICIDFIPELINQPHLQKQLFAVQLISHLAVQYPIPKSYSMCNYVMQRMSDLLAALPVVKRNQYFIPATECLVRICKAFPPLREEVTSLLLKLGKISLSQMKKSSGVVTSTIKLREEKVEENKEEKEEEDFEMDVDNSESNQPKKLEIKTVLDDNPSYSRDTFSESCSSIKLFDATEKAFELITDLTLREKLVSLNGDKLPANET